MFLYNSCVRNLQSNIATLRATKCNSQTTQACQASEGIYAKGISALFSTICPLVVDDIHRKVPAPCQKGLLLAQVHVLATRNYVHPSAKLDVHQQTENIYGLLTLCTLIDRGHENICWRDNIFCDYSWLMTCAWREDWSTQLFPAHVKACTHVEVRTVLPAQLEKWKENHSLLRQMKCKEEHSK